MYKRQGIHHVSFRCSGEQLRRVIAFYSDTLGIPIIRRWGPDCDNPIGVMFDTGNGIIEVFSNAESDLPQGVIRHFALSVTDVDELADRIEKAGYEVFVKPKNIYIPAENPLVARIAFCYGLVSYTHLTKAEIAFSASFFVRSAFSATIVTNSAFVI